METFDILLKELSNIPGLDNGSDRLLYPFKGGSFEEDKKRFLGIDSSERIIYIREISSDNDPMTLAITDKGIYFRTIARFYFIKLLDKSWNIRFKHIDEVKYSESEDAFLFSNGATISRHNLVKKLDKKWYFIFAEILTKAAKSDLGVMDYLTKGIELMQNDKEEEALEEFDKALEECSTDTDFGNSDDRAYVYFYRGRCLVLLGEEEDARRSLILAKEVAQNSFDPDVRNIISAINANLAWVAESRIESHKLLLEAYEEVTDSDIKKQLFERIESLHNSEEFMSDFNSTDTLSERKVLLVMRDNTPLIPSKSLICLERGVVRTLGLSFPISHPVEGAVYFAHPTRANYYIPAAQYEEAVFLEKVNEYCYLLRCLGAKEIKIQKICGTSIEKMSTSHVSVDTSIGGKSYGIEGNFENKSQNNSTSSGGYEFKNSMTFKPTKKPYVPKDLNWLAIEPKWQRLIDNRLSGVLTHFVEEISTSEDKLLSDIEETALNAELGTLMTKFKGSIKTESFVSSSSKQTTTWRIEVTFTDFS